MRFFSLSLSSLTLAMVALVATPPTVAEARSFSQCVASKWPAAQRIGVTRANFERATQGLQPDTKTTRLVNRQAEFVKPIWEYLDSAVSATRVKNGRAMLRKYSNVLDEIERRFEVDREAVIAIWGMETKNQLPTVGLADGIFFQAGFSGHGMGMAFLLSKYLVEWCLEKSPLPGWSQVASSS